MNNLQLINTKEFNGMSCDVYSDGNILYMNRTQIGRALGYAEPRKMVAKIHERHKERLDRYSVLINMDRVPQFGVRGVVNNSSAITTPLDPRGTDDNIMYLYNQRGIMEICRWSRQPLADKFMDWAWDIIEAYRDGSLAVVQPAQQTPMLTEGQIEQIIDEKLSQFKSDALAELKADMEHKYEELLKPAKFNITSTTKTVVQEPMDIMREAITPLAERLNDNSVGHNLTFRRVYAAMDVSWQVRQSRYRNQHGNKNRPSKIKLIADDPKLMKMFMAVVNDMKSQFEA